jgi:hypothetical protein
MRYQATQEERGVPELAKLGPWAEIRLSGQPWTVGQKIAAWETCRNAARATVQWQFTTAKARRKLKGLYPA